MREKGGVVAPLGLFLMSGVILVIGGTGFVGRAVVQRLHKQGHAVRVLARKPERATDLQQLTGCEVVPGDVLDSQSLASAMVGTRAIIHCAGVIAETRKASFEDIHGRGMENVALAARAADIRRIVLISAVGARAGARSRYHHTKWLGESAIRDPNYDWTILRPSLIYGPGDHFTTPLVGIMKSRLNFLRLLPLPLPQNGGRYVQPVYVEDVAECCVRALSHHGMVRHIYDVVGPRPLRWRDLITEVGEAAGVALVYEALPWRAALRLVALAGVILLPLLLVMLLACGSTGLPVLLFLGALWLAAADIALLQRTVAAFSIPTILLQAGALLGDLVLPRHLRFSEQLKLAEEDSEGYAQGLAAVLDHEPTPLEEGLRCSLKQ